MEKQVSDLDQCVKVRRWVRLTESEIHWEKWGWESASAVCEREGEGEWEWRMILWGVIFENTLFEIEYQSLDFLAFHVED